MPGHIMVFIIREMLPCRIASSSMGCGVFVVDGGSHLNAHECKVMENGCCGALVTGGGHLSLTMCEVIEHLHGAGMVVQGQGSRIDLQQSTIVGCGAAGLLAFDGAHACCKGVKLSYIRETGVEVWLANKLSCVLSSMTEGDIIFNCLLWEF